LAVEAAKTGKTIEDLMAIPEQDKLIYEGIEPRDGWSYVCSAYVAAFYKAAGMFDNLDIQGTEFTPKDVYSLNFFDKNYKKSDACEKANPGNNLGCQFLGKYKQTFPSYSTVDPY
jgi:hypothetical protein